MKYLITGGAGFIGKNLTSLLLSKMNNVVSIDNFENSSFSDIEKYTDNDRYKFIEADISDYSISHLVYESDIVIHLAATVGVQNAVDNPAVMMSSNLKGMLNVVNLCSMHGKRLLIASSSEVYGWSPKIPFKETDELVIPNPEHSRFNYALSKIVEEYYALGLYKQKSLPVTIFRLFNSTGPGQNNNHNLVLPNFINQALNGDDITVYGDGNQSRCFCHVGETVKAIHGLSVSSTSIGETFNIGSNISTTMIELAEMVKRISGSTSKIVTIPYEKVFNNGFSDMRERVPNLDKIENQIGWKSTIDIKTIVEEFIKDEMYEGEYNFFH